MTLDTVRGETALAKQYDVHPKQIADWAHQSLKRAACVFGAEPADEPEADQKQLHAEIG